MTTEPDKGARKRQRNTYFRYGGLGVQLVLTIGIAGWLGYKLDEYLSLKFPAFLLLFVLGAFCGTLYKLYRAIRQQK